MNLIFPPKILLSHYHGNFHEYLKAIYNVFENDFINSKPMFNSLDVSVRKYPEFDGWHRTFYHITHEGKDEQNRKPDLNRMERIQYPRFVIDKSSHSEILIWKNNRGRDKNILMLNDKENYLVVLTERDGYYLFKTAYYIENNHRKRKLLKEYNAYLNAKTA